MSLESSVCQDHRTCVFEEVEVKVGYRLLYQGSMLSLKNTPLKVLDSSDIELAASAINNEITVSRDQTFGGIQLKTKSFIGRFKSEWM